MDPHPVIMTMRDTGKHTRVLLWSNSTTITGWGLLLTYRVGRSGDARFASPRDYDLLLGEQDRILTPKPTKPEGSAQPVG